MLKTPLTVLLVRRCLILDSVGEAGASEMAESTLLRGSVFDCTSAAIVWVLSDTSGMSKYKGLVAISIDEGWMQ